MQETSATRRLVHPGGHQRRPGSEQEPQRFARFLLSLLLGPVATFILVVFIGRADRF